METLWSLSQLYFTLTVTTANAVPAWNGAGTILLPKWVILHKKNVNDLYLGYHLGCKHFIDKKVQKWVTCIYALLV